MTLYCNVLYIIEACGFSVVKIGRTNDIDKRLGALQCGHFAQLAIVALSRRAGAEKAVHRRMKDFRIRGEWFDFRADAKACLRAAIEELEIPLESYGDLFRQQCTPKKRRTSHVNEYRSPSLEKKAEKESKRRIDEFLHSIRDTHCRPIELLTA